MKTQDITLYNRTSAGEVQVWRVWVDGTTVHREWGLRGGKTITTSDTMSAKKGRPAELRAAEKVQALVEDRLEKGWSPKISSIRDTVKLVSDDFDFMSLPMSFAPQKPVTEPPLHNAALAKIVGRYLYQRKRDGQRHYVLKTLDGEVRIYSRRMEEKTHHMPRLRRAFERDIDLPRGSVIDGELIVDRLGADDFRATGSICRAGESRAATAEKQLPVHFMPFDILWLKKQPVWKMPYRNRWAMLQDIFGQDEDMFILPQTWDRFEPAKTAVLKNKWEGLVIWDLDKPNALRMNGKHMRDGCYKWKPIQEGDFVATGWLPGNGRLQKTMGKLLVAEYQKGKLVEIGRVGSGFDDETRDAVAAGKWTFPCVVTLEYDKQEEDSRALRFPVFLRQHPDKSVKELR